MDQRLRPQRLRSSFSKHLLYAVGGALALAVAGTTYIATPRSSVTTDDAYLKADSTTVASRVRGQVVQVLANENQAVKAGDPLVRINSEEFDARAASASADLKSAEAGVQAAEAALASLEAEEQLTAANVKAAESLIQSADAQSRKASADQKRYDKLILTGTASQRDADLYRTTAITAQSEADRARAALDVSKSQTAVTRARRPLLMAQLAQAEAALGRAKAALDLARQDQEHTSWLPRSMAWLGIGWPVPAITYSRVRGC